MVTKEELRGYRVVKRELAELHRRKAEAERGALYTSSPSERQAALRVAKRYERIIAERTRSAERIEAAIQELPHPLHRSVLYYRFIKGWGRLKTAVVMEKSERSISYLTRDAIRELENQ